MAGPDGMERAVAEVRALRRAPPRSRLGDAIDRL